MGILLKIFQIFIKIGVFTIGGGLAALPLLQEDVLRYQFMSKAEFADMLALSQCTPGAIGVNMATYTGFSQAGILGSITATLGFVLPGFLIVLVIGHSLNRFKESQIIAGIFRGIRPSVIALIFFAVLNIALLSLFNQAEAFSLNALDIKALCLFAVVLGAVFYFKWHPLIYIGASALIGLILF